MEDLKKKGIENVYIKIFTEFPFCSITGLIYVQDEDKLFGIEQKVKQLDKIIDIIFLRLNEIKDSSKENIIKTIREKKKELNEILVKFAKIKKQYLENDKYYRDLFHFYAIKHSQADIFEFDNKKKYMAIMIDIQKTLSAKFDEFRDEYITLKKSFFKINDYLLKIELLFNIII
jgi:hypothetical protein